MNRQTIVVAGGALVLVVAVVVAMIAFMGSSDGGAETMTMGDGQTMATSDMPADAASTDVSFDQAFIDAMVPHHRSAIAMANAALDAGLKEPQLRSIAQAIVDNQQDEIDRMLEWRRQWYGSAELGPDAGDQLGMSMDDMGMAGDPATLTSSGNVDADFASMMIVHHDGAIAMAQMAPERSKREEIRTLAQAIIAAQEDEIATMKPFAEE